MSRRKRDEADERILRLCWAIMGIVILAASGKALIQDVDAGVGTYVGLIVGIAVLLNAVAGPKSWLG